MRGLRRGEVMRGRDLVCGRGRQQTFGAGVITRRQGQHTIGKSVLAQALGPQRAPASDATAQGQQPPQHAGRQRESRGRHEGQDQRHAEAGADQGIPHLHRHRAMVCTQSLTQQHSPCQCCKEYREQFHMMSRGRAGGGRFWVVGDGAADTAGTVGSASEDVAAGCGGARAAAWQAAARSCGGTRASGARRRCGPSRRAAGGRCHRSRSPGTVTAR